MAEVFEELERISKHAPHPGTHFEVNVSPNPSQKRPPEAGGQLRQIPEVRSLKNQLLTSQYCHDPPGPHDTGKRQLWSFHRNSNGSELVLLFAMKQ